MRVEAACACGAVGRLVDARRWGAAARAPSRRPRLEWRGGRVGAGRVAVEEARTGPGACPACQHRACVFMLLDADTEPSAT